MAAWVTTGLPPTGMIDGSSVAVDGFVRMFGTLAIVALLAAYAALLVLAVRSRARAHGPLDEGQDQLDVDRFYRYNESLQEFFNEAAAVETRFAA
jgi:hypothetical protein